MDTLGSLVDKIFTTDEKMFLNQDLFYEIRHMSFDDFKKQFYSEEGMKVLWDRFKKGMDLNLQRNALIDEFDETFIKILKDAINGEDLDNGKYIQRKHKTY